MINFSQDNIRGFLFTILAFVVVAGLIVYPPLFNKGADFARDTLQVDIGSLSIPFRLGLDLQGGTHLIYEADMSQITGITPQEAMNAVRDVIERRVNLFGVQEPVVQIARSGESWRLIVELAGVKDIKEAVALIGETPFLEFREQLPEEEGGDVLGYGPTELNGSFLERAQVQFSGGGHSGGPGLSTPVVALDFTSEGAAIFEELTKKNLGKNIAIYLDGVPISAPVVQTIITGGQAVITGGFTIEEAQLLAGRMNAGALPVPITLISQQTIGASLGQDSLNKALDAGFWGLAILAVLMILYYRLPGLVGIVALSVYILFLLAIFKAIPVTLTLAGIAGFILSLGIAIDANILIFERMKEELQEGKSVESAITEGFLRSWTSIRDGNVTTIITAIILYWIGSSFVQGFALTLTVGILISMFTAVFVSRLLLEVLAGTQLGKMKTIWKAGLQKI